MAWRGATNAGAVEQGSAPIPLGESRRYSWGMTTRVALLLVLGGLSVLAWDAWRAPALDDVDRINDDDVSDDGTVDDDEENDCQHDDDYGADPRPDAVRTGRRREETARARSSR